MFMKKIIYILALLLAFGTLQAQQDPQLSHYFFAKSFYNSSYAGYEDKICINVLSHQQWNKFEGAPLTNMLSIDGPVNLFGLDAGVGVNIIDDRYGEFVNDFRGKINLAYNFDLPVGSLRVGLSPGFFSKKIKGAWKFPDQSETILTDDKNVFVFDIGGGVYYTVSNYHLGFSSSHLLKPKFEFVSESGNNSSVFLVNHFYLMTGYTFNLLSSVLELTPSVFIKSDISSLQYDINLFALYNKKFWASVTYRNRDAFAFFVGTSIFANTRLGLSYDLTLSYLNRVSNGTFEAYIGYNFSFVKPANAQKYRNVKTL